MEIADGAPDPVTEASAVGQSRKYCRTGASTGAKRFVGVNRTLQARYWADKEKELEEFECLSIEYETDNETRSRFVNIRLVITMDEID